MEKRVYVTPVQMFKHLPPSTQFWYITNYGHSALVEGFGYSGMGEPYIVTEYGLHYVVGGDLFQITAEDAARYLPKAV